MKVIIGSKNPAKVLAVKAAFKNYECVIESINVPSGVSEQPFSDNETIQGAINRAMNALTEGKGDIGIGLEGGVQKTKHGLFLCNWGALSKKDAPPIIAGGARILLPHIISERLYASEELGPVMEEYANKQNVSKREGAIGIFSNGQINRSEMFLHIIKLLVGQYEYRNIGK